MNNPSISNPPTSFPTEGVPRAIEEIISAWAFAHNIDGAARNDLFARLRASPQLQSTEAVERVADCCLPGGACYEAGLSDVQHKVEPLEARVAQALSDSAGASWDNHKVRDDWNALARAAITALTSPAVVEDPVKSVCGYCRAEYGTLEEARACAWKRHGERAPATVHADEEKPNA